MAKEELVHLLGIIVMLGALGVMIIILAVLVLVVVKALTNSPWGFFTIAATIPIALFMGVYMRYLRPGKIMEVSIIGFVLMMAAIIFGENIAQSSLAPLFTLMQLNWFGHWSFMGLWRQYCRYGCYLPHVIIYQPS